MKFGVREICNVVFRAKAVQKIGNATFQKGQPVLYIDSAKTSTLEGAATTVYAQGGRGNVRLVSWEGEKTLTFTVEDALISPISFAMLSGAGVIKGTSEEKVHVHMTTTTTVGESNRIDLSEALGTNKICDTAPIFIMGVETGDGSLENPYASLERAIQDAGGLSNIIYIQPGVYENMALGRHPPLFPLLQSKRLASESCCSFRTSRAFS